MLIKKLKYFDRKADVRRKIALGGLIIKAKLDYMHPKEAYILYGMLLDCKIAISKKPEIIHRWAELGKELLIGNVNNGTNTGDKNE